GRGGRRSGAVHERARRDLSWRSVDVDDRRAAQPARATGGRARARPRETVRAGDVARRRIVDAGPARISGRGARMRLIRYRDADGRIRAAHEDADGRAWLLEGDPFGTFSATTTPVTVTERLSPIVPTQIMGIGLNYRRHAQ